MSRYWDRREPIRIANRANIIQTESITKRHRYYRLLWHDSDTRHLNFSILPKLWVGTITWTESTTSFDTAICLPSFTVCSTTLWVGHLSKLVSQEELSDTFGEFGEIDSINLIPPRGCGFICMNRRQDAYKAHQQLKHSKLGGKAITVRTILSHICL